MVSTKVIIKEIKEILQRSKMKREEQREASSLYNGLIVQICQLYKKKDEQRKIAGGRDYCVDSDMYRLIKTLKLFK